jgi:hypothetical protein
MKNRMALIPAIFLGSGAALIVCGLAIMVAYGAKAPIAALALLAAGLLDGVTGLVWTLVMLFARKDEVAGGAGPSGPARGRTPSAGPESPERLDEARRAIVLASGLLAVIFLGAVLAILLYLHVIIGCLRSWQLL